MRQKRDPYKDIAWFVEYWEDEGGVFLHAPTRGKAKVAGVNLYPGYDDLDFTEIRAYRVKELDDLPLTLENLQMYGYCIQDQDGQAVGPGDYVNECHCSNLCMPYAAKEKERLKALLNGLDCKTEIYYLDEYHDPN